MYTLGTSPIAREAGLFMIFSPCAGSRLWLKAPRLGAALMSQTATSHKVRDLYVQPLPDLYALPARLESFWPGRQKKRRLSEVASACFSITLAMLIGHIKKQVYCVTAWCDVDLFSKPYGISNSSVPRVFAPAAHRGQAPSDGRSEPEKAEKPTQSRGATSL